MTQLRGKLLIAMAVAVLVVATACEQVRVASLGAPDSAAPAATRMVQWPDNWPVPPLPVMSLRHEAGTIQGDPHAYCWQFEGNADRVCEKEANWAGSYEYPEIEPPHRISITIDAESVPSKLFAQVYTKPGNIKVGGLRRLSAINPRLDLQDVGPGLYNVRLIGYWEDNNVSYEFGLFIPGEVELTALCEMTLQGVKPPVLPLQSLDDPMRTAFDSANSGGCKFNKPIARVTMTLHNDALGTLTETFHIDPPKVSIGFPLPRNLASETTGGLLPAGRYSRRVSAYSEDGEEWNLNSRMFHDVILAAP